MIYAFENLMKKMIFGFGTLKTKSLLDSEVKPIFYFLIYSCMLKDSRNAISRKIPETIDLTKNSSKHEENILTSLLIKSNLSFFIQILI
jgi:hypothetical protein